MRYDPKRSPGKGIRDVPCPSGKDRAFIQRVTYAEGQNTVWCAPLRIERMADRL